MNRRTCWIRTTLTLAAVLALGLVPATAEAQGCQSAAQVASDLWKEYGKIARQVGCVGSTAAAAAGSMGATLPASAAMYARCMKTSAAADKTTRGMVSRWNDLVNNSWAHIGPRRLEIGQSHEGTIRSTFQRAFVTSHPVLRERVTFSLSKEKFRGGTGVTVCKQAPGESPERLWHFEIEPGNPDTAPLYLQSFDEVAGHILMVVLDGKSGLKSMKYSLSVTGDRSIVGQADEAVAGEAGRENQDAAVPGALGELPIGSTGDADSEAIPAELEGMPSDVFARADRQRFDNGRRIADLELINGTLAGVWEPGSGAQYWHTGLSWGEFRTRNQDYFGRGLHLIDLEVGPGGYAGVWRPRDGAHRLMVDLSLDELRRQDAELVEQGLRLTDVEYHDGSYAAIWRSGQGAQWWHQGLSREQLAQQDREYLDQGLRLVDLEKTADGYLAVWGPGDGAQWWTAGMSRDELGGAIRRQVEDNGLRTVDLEVTADGYLAVWRPVEGPVEVLVQSR